MLKILVLCVLWFARKLVYRRTDGRTDGHGDNISVFFPMRKKALKTTGLKKEYIGSTAQKKTNKITKFLTNAFLWNVASALIKKH